MDVVHVDILDFYGREEYLTHIVKNIQIINKRPSIGLSFINDKFYDISGVECQLIDNEMYLILEEHNFKKVIYDLKHMIMINIGDYFENRKTRFIIPIYIYPETGEYFCGGANHWSIKLYNLLREIGVESYLCSPTCWKTPKVDTSYNFIDRGNININNDISICIGNYDTIPETKHSYLYYTSNMFYKGITHKILYMYNYITDNNKYDYYINNKHYNKIITSFEVEKLCIIKNFFPTFVEPYMNNFKIYEFHEGYYTLQHWEKKYILIYYSECKFIKIGYNNNVEKIKLVKSDLELCKYILNLSDNEIINSGSKSDFKSQKDIIEIFRNCGLFITDSYATYMSNISVLLGIESVVITRRIKNTSCYPLFGIKYGFDDNINFWKERELLLDYINTQNSEMKKNCEKLIYKIYKDVNNVL